MKTQKKALLSWSSGKDSAWALHCLRENPEVEIAGLFTVINEKHNRVSMHGTRTEVLRLQAAAVGLPLHSVYTPDPCPMEQYEKAIKSFIEQCVAAGIGLIAFGDLFLSDIREYRQDQLRGSGIDPIFPLWGRPTRDLAQQMLAAGVSAYVSCVDLNKLPACFVGKKWTQDLLSQYPEDCDPCGENGEIHTIVVDGPMFGSPIPVHVGEIIQRDGFGYADIIPNH